MNLLKNEDQHSLTVKQIKNAAELKFQTVTLDIAHCLSISYVDLSNKKIKLGIKVRKLRHVPLATSTKKNLKCYLLLIIAISQ